MRLSLGWPLALYLILMILLLTLAPFQFAWPTWKEVNLRLYWGDVASNILLLLPLGFILRLSIDRSIGGWKTILFCTMLSAAIETAQLFIIFRVTSPQDVLSNAIGACMGVVLCDWTIRWIDQSQTHVHIFELPIAMVFYLLTPVLWLNGLASLTEPTRIWLSIPLGMIGALIVGSIIYHRIGLPRAGGPFGVIAIVSLWYGMASLLGFFKSIRRTLAAIAITMALTTWMAFSPRLAFGPTGRFEAAIIRRCSIPLLVYLLLSKFFPFTTQLGPWRAQIPFEGMEMRYMSIPLTSSMYLIEQAAAYTLLGYLLAGLRSRKKESQAWTLGIVGLIVFVVSGAFESLRGYHPSHVTSVMQWMLETGSGLFGASFYRIHLNAVRKHLRGAVRPIE